MVHLIQNRDDLQQKICEAGNKLVVIDFFATWCVPCTMLTPYVEQLAAKYTEKAVVVKVDVDACGDIAINYAVSVMPTFVFLKNNHVVDIFTGGNAERLIKVFQKLVLPEEEGKPDAAKAKEAGDHDKNAEPQLQSVVDATQKTTQEIAQENTTDFTKEIAQ